MEELHGRSLISRLVERVAKSELTDEIVVATSVQPVDDQLEEHLSSLGVSVRRGPEDDVLARFVSVMDEFKPDVVVRLTGDNPLVDGAMVDLVLERHLVGGTHYTTNGHSGTFPYGSNVEAVDAEALRQFAERSRDRDEREHVTLGLTRRPDEYSLRSLSREPSHGHLRWTVDTPDDLTWVRSVFDHLVPTRGDFFTYEDVIAWIEADSSRLRGVSSL